MRTMIKLIDTCSIERAHEMKLKSTSLKWALKHVILDGDTDLLPTPFEFSVMKKQWPSVYDYVSKIDLSSHTWSGPRRFTVPKAEFSFRSVCQLDPVDSLLFTALMKEIGSKIERKRPSKA